MSLSTLITSLESFSFKDEQETIIRLNADKLADLQAEQFARGIDAQGRPIQLIDNPGGGYRPFTIQDKQQNGVGLGAITDRVTLYKTGALYRRLAANFTGDKFSVISNVPYWSVISNRVTTQSLLLSEDSRRTFAETFVLPGILLAYQKKVLNK